MDVKVMYSIFDKVAREYGPPFIANNDQVAMRAFKNEMPKEMASRIDEFALYRIGSFKISTGEVEASRKIFLVEDVINE